MNRFAGKRVVLTGGASGIGRATVEAFIAEGAQVMMGDINAETGAAMAAEAGFDKRLFFQQTDVTQEKDIRGLLDSAAQQFGGIDILFNNAGAAGPRKRIDEISVDEWDFVQNLLLRSVMLGIRHVVPHMRVAGGGAIVILLQLRVTRRDGAPSHTPWPNAACGIFRGSPLPSWPCIKFASIRSAPV